MGSFTKKIIVNFCITVVFILAWNPLHAQIASWTYEPQLGALANPTPNTGTGSSAVVNTGGGSIALIIRTGMAGTGCGDQNGVSAWALEPFDPGSVNQGNGAQFTAPTTGYQNIVFTWDQRWSNTAPNTVRLQYTLNGSTWTNFVMTAANTTYCLGSINASGCFEASAQGDKYRRISVDFSSVTGANNNANFGVRLLAAHHQSTGQFRRTDDPTQLAGTAGTWRFDNVAFTGTPLPGPTASVISGTTSICAGGSANIKVVITGGTSPFTLVYFNGVSNVTVNNYVSNTNIPVSPAASTTYTIVSVTDANGTAGTGNTGSAVITVNPLPTVTAANITTCVTGALALTGGSPAGGTYSIANPYSGPTTTFTYTYTNANGCTKTSATYTFTRNTAPSINAQPSTAAQTACQGTAFTPLAVAAAGTNLSYQWYSNTVQSTTGGTSLTTAAHIANGSQTASFTPLSATVGTLYYYVIVSGTCSPPVKSTATGAFITTPAPVSGTVSASQTICGGTQPADLVLAGQTGTVAKWQKADDAAFTLNVTDIAVTATTLAGTMIGSLSQTTYFRACVQNGSCVAAVTTPVQIEVKSTVWDGAAWSNGAPDGSMAVVFDADYNSSGDIAACSATVNAGTVVFNPGDTFTVFNAVVVAGGTLRFENNASLVQINDAANTGAIQYKRDTTPIRRYDYTYWSSPVGNQLLFDVSPLTRFDKFYWFDSAAYNWVIADATTTVMDIGKGYIIRGPQSYDETFPVAYHATFIGTPNNGEYTVPVFVNGAQDFNLLGNPYPSAIDADLLMSDPENAAALGTGTTIYLWTHNTPVTNLLYSFSDYATYNYTGGTGTAPSSGANNTTPSGFIAAGQSFFIKGIATGTAKFKNAMRTPGNNDQFFRTAAQKDRLWLELSNDTGAFKQMLLGYVSNATNGFDNGYDGPVFDGGNSASLYSLLDGEKLAIQGRALPFADTDTVALGYKAATAGTYELKLSQFEGLFQDQGVFLEDQLAGIVHNLKESPYSFDSAAGTFDDRFTLRFMDAALGNPDAGIVENIVIIYRNLDVLYIDTGATVMDEVQLFDMTGRLVAVKKGIHSNTAQFRLGAMHQPLVARIKSTDGKTTTKKLLL